MVKQIIAGGFVIILMVSMLQLTGCANSGTTDKSFEQELKEHEMKKKEMEK